MRRVTVSSAPSIDRSSTRARLAWLTPTRALGIILAVGVVVFSPAIRSPLFLDDFLHDAMVRGQFPVPRAAWNLYDFIGDDNRQLLTDRGLLPWWTHPELKIRFFRPLASVLLWLDHRLFGQAPLPPHLHSLAWWAAATAAAFALFRRVLPKPETAILATAIYALAPCHFLAIAWSANREALIAITIGTLGLLSHLSFRERGHALGALLTTLLFSLALLGGGEYALGFGGYLLLSEVLRPGERKPLALRLAWLLPFALPAAIYLPVRASLGYGAAGSGFYADPFHDPGSFVSVAPYHFVAQLADAWLSFGSHQWQPTWERGIVVGAVALATLAMVRPIRAALREAEERDRYAASWLLGGSILALVPTLAVVPAFRLLGIAMLGVAATSARVIERLLRAPERATRAGEVGAVLLAFTQLVHGPVMTFLESSEHRRLAKNFVERADWLRAKVGDPGAARVAAIRGGPTIFFTPFAMVDRTPPPHTWLVLAETSHVLALRTGERTIELVAQRDRALSPIGELNLYRDPRRPLRPGDELRVPGLRATVLEITERGPRRVRIDLDEPIDAYTWVDDGLERMTEITLPPVGNGWPFSG